MTSSKEEIIQRLGTVIMEMMHEKFSGIKEDLLRELDVSGAWREMVRKLLDGLFGELESIFGEGSVMLTGGRRMERGFLEPKVEIMENTFPSFDDTVELPDPYATASTKTLDDKGACSNPGAPDEWKSAEDSQKASPSSGSTPKQYCKQCGKKVRVGASHTCEKPFKCEICGMSFPYRYRLSLHLRTHPTANVSCVPRKYSRGGSEKTCGQCGKAVAENEWHDCEDQSTSASGSADGEARQHCKDCGKKVSVSASHTCEKPFKCEVCGMCFPYRYRLNLHLRTHPNATVTCEPRKYSSSSKKGPLQYCKGCGKKVSINTPHACEKPFKCEVCGLGFPYQFRLNLHLRTHSSAKEFQCEYCGKSFRLPGSYIEHKKIHLNLKPHKCHVCPQAFRNKSNLTVHMRSHTGEKPYTCQVCDKSFARSGQLKIHSRIHLGLKPYECDICGFRCSQSQDLKRHVNRHVESGHALLSSASSMNFNPPGPMRGMHMGMPPM